MQRACSEHLWVSCAVRIISMDWNKWTKRIVFAYKEIKSIFSRVAKILLNNLYYGSSSIMNVSIYININYMCIYLYMNHMCIYIHEPHVHLYSWTTCAFTWITSTIRLVIAKWLAATLNFKALNNCNFSSLYQNKKNNRKNNGPQQTPWGYSTSRDRELVPRASAQTAGEAKAQQAALWGEYSERVLFWKQASTLFL